MIKNNKAPLPERIEEILEELGDAYHNNYPDENALREATKQINLLLAEVIDEVLPDEEKLSKGDPHLLSKVAYNQAIAEIKERVKDMLGEK